MKTLKYEQVYLIEYDNLAEAKRQIGHFLEVVYNQKRLHSSLGYLRLLGMKRSMKRSPIEPTKEAETRTRP